MAVWQRSRPATALALMVSAWVLTACGGQESIAVRREHPRVFLCAENLEAYRKRLPQHPGWRAFQAKANAGGMVEAAFCYQITGERDYAAIAAKALAAEAQKAKPDMKAMALTFDWAFDELPADLRHACVEKMAAWLRFGRVQGLDAWEPPPKQWYVWTFHSESWCGWEVAEHYVLLALAHHHPNAAPAYRSIWEMGGWKDACDLLDYLGDGAWPEGSYWVIRAKFALMTKPFIALKTATGVDYFGGKHRYLNQIGYFVLYQSDPYRHKLWNTLGDATSIPLTYQQHRLNMLLANSQARNPYYQWFLREACGYEPGSSLDDILFYDPTVPARPPTDGLPPARLFPSMNLAIMRSDWTKDAMAVSFVNSDYYDCHVHFDNGSFIVYKGGATQVPDTGLYTYSGIPHFVNYYMRTVAHNTLLVDDPNERIRYYLYWSEANAERDGGQRYPGRAQTFARFRRRRAETDLGDTLAYRHRPLYTYAVGDATRAYAREKLREFVRTLLFIRPNYLVVFDRVETTKADFTKRWVMHLEGEPQIAGQPIDVEVKGHIETFDRGPIAAVHPANGQRLVCYSLLPERRRVTRIGGRLAAAADWESSVLERGVFEAKDRRHGHEPLCLTGLNKLAREPRQEALIQVSWHHGALSSIRVTVDDHGVEVQHTGSELLKVPPKKFRVDYAAAPTLGRLVAALNREFAGSRWDATLIAGYAWWNQGKNYPPEPGGQPGLYKRAMGHYKDLTEELSIGRWRIEVSPAQPARRDCFLHLIHLPDGPDATDLEPQAAQEGDQARLEFADAQRRYRITFATAGEPACTLTVEDKTGAILARDTIPAKVDIEGQP